MHDNITPPKKAQKNWNYQQKGEFLKLEKDKEKQESQENERWQEKKELKLKKIGYFAF